MDMLRAVGLDVVAIRDVASAIGKVPMGCLDVWRGTCNDTIDPLVLATPRKDYVLVSNAWSHVCTLILLFVHT